MQLWYLPYVREGFRPSGDGFSATVAWRPQTRVNTRVVAPGKAAHDTATRFDLLGPGDVLGIDAAQVLRVLPAPNSERAEPEFFPAVEFDAPDLPWAYSPVAPSANRVVPWMCLIVVEDQDGVTVQDGTTGQSRWILTLDPAVAAHELPVLSEAWAWAHAQVTCDTQAQITDTLANAPDRTISRLLAPRRLLPGRRYIACVVPTYLAGVVAGLGGDPEAIPATSARNPAWTPTDLPPQLPVYHTWSFTTGEAGDVESMLRRLRPAPAPDGAGRTLNARLASTDTPAVLDWQPPLRRPKQPTVDPRPAAIVAGIRAALAPDTATGPVVGPPYLGEPWVAGRTLDPITTWTPALNLTPMARAAAGLGSELVRERQEDMVAAVWEQFTAYRDADRQQRAQQLSAIVENQVKDRLQQAPIEQASRVLGPVVAQAVPDAPSVGLRTAVGRRTTNKIWRISPRMVDGTQPRPALAAAAAQSLAAADQSLAPDAQPTPQAPPSIAVMRSAQAAPGAPRAAALLRLAATETTAAATAADDSEVGGTPPPLADTRTLLARGDASYQGTLFAPRLNTPLAEVLADRFRALLLPSTAQISPDSLLAVEADRTFVEAFLVGANQELNRELLWRALPADPRATALRRFWNRTDQGDDIPAIADWPATGPLGGNSAPMDAGVLLRSEIVHRCPSLVVAAVPAVWGADGKRRPSGDPATLKAPIIRTLVGDDLLYVGFAGLTVAAMVGGAGPSEPAGWFIMLAENPVDPRFGLDPPVTPAPAPARGELSWSNVRMATGDTYARASGLPSIPALGFSFGTANGASVANVLQQRRFRAFLHGSALARSES
jgi:hypothetical protein